MHTFAIATFNTISICTFKKQQLDAVHDGGLILIPTQAGCIYQQALLRARLNALDNCSVTTCASLYIIWGKFIVGKPENSSMHVWNSTR